MPSDFTQTLASLLGAEVGFVKVTYESADRFENVSLQQPQWAFRRGMLVLSLEFQTLSPPKPRYGSLHIMSADKVDKVSPVEPDRWACTAHLLAGLETSQILNSL